ncbi:BspA family leucine-rich repeat surface protein [bacterium]|nr:BspA family leucine-rich repeat surface protein [bacterium]
MHNVTDMNNMFCNIKGIKWLDLSSFDTSSVTNMQNMFYNCTNLT